MSEPWNLTEAQRRQFREAQAAAKQRQMGQVPSDHPDAHKPVAAGEHPRDCDCGDCPCHGRTGGRRTRDEWVCPYLDHPEHNTRACLHCATDDQLERTTAVIPIPNRRETP